MPFGLILPVLLALWLSIGNREQTLASWRLKPLSALSLILGTLILSYINIPLGPIFLNLGALFLSGFTLWLFIGFRAADKARVAAAAILIAALVFVAQNGLLWQIDQFFAYSEAAALLLAMVFAAAAGGGSQPRGYRQALAAAAFGAVAAHLATIAVVGGGAWLPYLNICVLAAAGAWLILKLGDYFRRRQLTNAR